MSRPVDLTAVLAARDRRVLRQQTFLRQYHCPLVSFTMNIAGPVKHTPLIEDGFRMGCRLLEDRLAAAGASIRSKDSFFGDTGCEALYAVAWDAAKLKALTTELEDRTPAGRLFDLDVLDADGRKLDRATPRTCLICGRPGAECARSRSHTVTELQTKTASLLTAARQQWGSQAAARHATRALLYEVTVTPKPGLVDRANTGSHRDMDFYTFLDSTAALQPYFADCFLLGCQSADLSPAETFRALRSRGITAEQEMLAATDGVNTHKGAVFTLGIVCGALGRLPLSRWTDAADVLAQCAAMTQGITGQDLAGLTEETACTPGQKLYLRHGITGVRGQMEQGLPTVLSHGLPALELALSQGKSKDEAGCAALLALLSVTPDTNLMARGGVAAAGAVSRQAAALLQTGWTLSDLQAMDQDLIEKNLSPGGCADLLAVCWMLHFLKER